MIDESRNINNRKSLKLLRDRKLRDRREEKTEQGRKGKVAYEKKARASVHTC